MEETRMTLDPGSNTTHGNGATQGASPTPPPLPPPLFRLKAMPPARPWWRYGFVWLVISGPAVVVVAALVTAWIAIVYQDPVLDEDYYRHGLEINKTLGENGKAMMPAMQGRNHAATPPRP
jgi:hypothetical protein